MSDRRIMSALRLVTPYTLSRWFRLPLEDMFSELQLTEAMVIFGTVQLAASMLVDAKRAVQNRAAKRAVPPKLLFLGKRERHALLTTADLAPEGASPIMIGPRGSSDDKAGSTGKGGLVFGSIHELRKRGEGSIYLFLLFQNLFCQRSPTLFLHTRLGVLSILVFLTRLSQITGGVLLTGPTSREA